MRLRSKWVPLAAAATLTACAVGSEVDSQPFSPAKDDAGVVQDSMTAVEIGPIDGGFTFDSGVPDSTLPDTNVDETVAPMDTGDPDAPPADTGPDDTGSDPDTADEASIEVGPDAAADGSADETASLDAADETIPADTDPPDTTPVDTGDPDTGTPDTGTPDTGSVVDSSPADVAPEAPPPGPPTVTIDGPADNTSIKYSKTSDACLGQPFSVTYTAPAGLASMQWKFFTPDASKATTGMLGTCTGAAAYGYFLDPAKYAGDTGATLQENVAVSGIYTGSAGTGRWWWCGPPGTAPNAFVASAPAPGTPGLQTLANYCSAKSTPPPTDLGSRWRLEVTVTDKAGKTAVANLYFWVHQ
ncbi:MAG: hypothetical protein ACXVEF_37180 [Polyangiales bacterium]